MTVTARDGRVSKLEQVFRRGGRIKFVVLPDILKNAPIFKAVRDMKAKLPPLTLGGRKPRTAAAGGGGYGAGAGAAGASR